MQTSNELRKNNTLTVLRVILESGAMTKVDCAAKTGLTLMTANTIINQLLQRKILAESGIAESSSGRKAALYAVNPRAYHLVGVNIGVDKATVAVSDLRLNREQSLELPMDSRDPASVLADIRQAIVTILANLAIAPEQVLGLGITVPGPVDETSGAIHFLPNLKGWENVAVKAFFTTAFAFPVFVEKDNYASVLQIRRQLGLASENVVLLTVMGGIGTGILLGGRLYRGENGVAGEIGHTTVEADGSRCNCGNIGCLEHYASDFSIVREVRDKLQPGGTGGLSGTPDIDRIIAAARNGDDVCRTAILKAARYLGTAIGNAIKFYDPACFIINCRWVKEIEGVSDAARRAVIEKGILLHQQKLNLIFHDDQDAFLQSALNLVVEHALADLAANRLLDGPTRE